MIKLIIEDDEGRTTIVPLIRDEITIGRKEGNTIRLTERNVSRRHAKLIKQNGKVYLEDLNSYNGILVNGERISGRVAISEGDRIQIGDYILALKYDRPQAAPKPDPFEEMKTIPLERAPQPAAQATPGPGPQPAQPAPAQPAAAQPTAAQPEPAQVGPAQAAAGAVAPASVQPPAEAGAAQVAAPAPAAEPHPPARFVVVSKDLFGAEFLLDRPTMTIGRMPENDIVLDHRSISRHHARVLRENNHYIIVDLGSQNGVVVNGEKYDRVQLRKGDIIDLGHIRLRFVAPGEEFVPSKAAAGLPEKSKLGLAVVLGVVAVAVVVVAVLAWPSGKKKSKKPQATPSRPAPVAQAQMDGRAPQAESLDYSKIQSALAAHDWTKAAAEAKQFLAAHRDDKNAKRMLRQAQREARNEKRYRAFLAAWKAGNVAKAATLGKDFPSDSYYYQDVQNLWPQVAQEYVNQLLAKARHLAKRNRCTEVRVLARRALEYKPDELRFQTLIERCGKPAEVAEARPTRTRARTRTPRRASAPPSPRPSELSTEDKAAKAAELLQQARAAFGSGNCGKAITLARKSYKLRPSAGAVTVIGTCACTTGRRSLAAWAARRVRGGRRNLLIKVCRGKGINLE